MDYKLSLGHSPEGVPLRLSKKSDGLFRQPEQCLAFLPAKRAEKLPLRGANAF